MTLIPCDKTPSGQESAAYVVYRNDRPSPVLTLCGHHMAEQVEYLAASPVAYYAMPLRPEDSDLPRLADVTFWGIPEAESVTNRSVAL